MSVLPSLWRSRQFVTCVAAALLLASSACGRNARRRSDSGQLPTRRLDGSWALSLRLDRRMSLSGIPASLPFTLHGTVTLMANDRSDVSFASIAEPTEIGVYALRLDSLGLASWQEGEMPTLAARETAPSSSVATGDSIVIVLNPGVPTRLVRLAGVFTSDVVRGEWTAESPLGGGGTFDLRRVTAAVAVPR